MTGNIIKVGHFNLSGIIKLVLGKRFLTRSTRQNDIQEKLCIWFRKIYWV